MKRLWGDSFFNAKKKTWTNIQQPEGCPEPLPRAFCQFIMSPINQLMRAIMNDDTAKYEKMMGTLGITLKGDEKSLTGKPLMKRAMQIWINAADTLLSMIVLRLPSPKDAQKYRVQNLYEGPHYKPGSKEDLNVKNVQRTVLMMGRTVEQIADVPCGNTVALVGVDQYILKSGTLTTIEDAHNIT